MSQEKFNNDCPGCKPVLLDAKTKTALPDDSPAMIAIMKIWKTLTLEERESFHRFTLPERHQSRKHGSHAENYRQVTTGPSQLRDQLLSPKQIAEILQLSPKTVKRRFEHEPGVVNLGTGKRSILRIPQSLVKEFKTARMRRRK